MNEIATDVWIALLQGLLDHKELCAVSAWLAAYPEEFERILQAIVVGTVVPAGADAILDALRAMTATRDNEHDSSRRALFYSLRALAEVGSGSDREIIRVALAKLFPHGLAVNAATYRAEVGATEIFAVACESAEVKAALPVMAKTLADPEALLERCVVAGRELGDGMQQVDAHIADLVGQDAPEAGSGLWQARNDCMSTWRMFLDSVDKAYPEGGPGSAARETLIGPYRRELDKAAKPAKKKVAGALPTA